MRPGKRFSISGNVGRRAGRLQATQAKKENRCPGRIGDFYEKSC